MCRNIGLSSGLSGKDDAFPGHLGRMHESVKNLGEAEPEEEFYIALEERLHEERILGVQEVNKESLMGHLRTLLEKGDHQS